MIVWRVSAAVSAPSGTSSGAAKPWPWSFTMRRIPEGRPSSPSTVCPLSVMTWPPSSANGSGREALPDSSVFSLAFRSLHFQASMRRCGRPVFANALKARSRAGSGFSAAYCAMRASSAALGSLMRSLRAVIIQPLRLRRHSLLFPAARRVPGRLS